MEDLKDSFIKDKSGLLKTFLDDSNPIELKICEPVVSIVLILYNRAELTLACIQSILNNVKVPVELVIVDNASSDRTEDLLSLIHGNVRIIKNEENLGFLLACNQAAEIARGKYLLFLNNDAEIHEGALSSALDIFHTEEKVGAVGGKVLLLDGSLQEAGCIVWRDGSCLGYGRTENPEKAPFNYQRDVDFCSGAFLLTPKQLFCDLGKFDERFVPAYYEEVDYCMTLYANDYRVVYNPTSVITHFEFASSSSSEKAIELQKKNRKTFVDKHSSILENQQLPVLSNTLKARQRPNSNGNILFIEDRVPHQDLGSGYPRSNEIVNILASLDYNVTIYSINFQKEDEWSDIYRDIDPRVEVVLYYNRPGFERFAFSRSDFYDLVWISRPPNMQFLKDKLFHFHEKTIFVYDAEAIFSERIKRQSENTDLPTEESYQASLQKELDLYRYVDQVLTVKNVDRELYEGYGATDVDVLSVIAEGEKTEASFDDRSGILFVGNMDYDDSPNVDSIVWFHDNVLKLIQKENKEVKLHLVGSAKSKLIRDLAKKNSSVVVHGRVSSLYDVYNEARIFIAPTRFSAGIPLKVFTSAAFGLPIIGSHLIIEQSGFSKDESIVEGDVENPADFALALLKVYSSKEKWTKLRNSALEHVHKYYSREAFENKIEDVVTELLTSSSEEGNVVERIEVDHRSNRNISMEVESLNGYIQELQEKNAYLTKSVSEGHDYVTGLLDQIAAKDLELAKRGKIIERFNRSSLFRLQNSVYGSVDSVGKIFKLTGIIVKIFATNPLKFVKNINLDNLNIVLRAFKKEPINKIGDNAKKFIQEQ